MLKWLANYSTDSTNSYVSFWLQMEIFRLTFQMSGLLQSHIFPLFPYLFISDSFSASLPLTMSMLLPIKICTAKICNCCKTHKYNSSKIICWQKIHFTRAVRVCYCYRQSWSDFETCLRSQTLMQLSTKASSSFTRRWQNKIYDDIADSLNVDSTSAQWAHTLDDHISRMHLTPI